MTKKIYILIFISILSLSFAKANPKPLSDSAQISLLTNTPWNGAVYALFGHTAIRVYDPIPTQPIDYVFNYGLFDFSSDNFIYRFAKGETDYWLGVEDFKRYLWGYEPRGIGIYEQVLNLKQEEKQKIWDALFINALPENREYRYNYFYDNCSTRPRDVIEENIFGDIHYTPTNREQTYRDLVHECVNNYPWVKFGIDLVIGSDADKTISDRQKMFLPLYLMNAYEGATIIGNNGSSRQLVKAENQLAKPKTPNDSHKAINYPLIVCLFVLGIAILFSYLHYKNKAKFVVRGFDFLLFFTAGIAGCILTFMVFVSEHPCTSPNWNLVWLNPFELIFAFLFFVKYLSKWVYYYHFINFVLLSLFVICWFFIPQQLNIAFLPLILSLWLRSGTTFVIDKTGKKN